MTTPRPRYSAQEVAKAFVTKYYVILNKSPEIAHKFYQESSLLGWPRLDGDIKTVTTLSGINGEIMSSDYKYCLFKTETVEVQESLEGGILIAVTGLMTLKDDVMKGFSQIFFLAKQEDGFFVLNDILQVDKSGFFTNTAIQDNQKKDQVAPTQNSGLVLSVPCTKSDHPASCQTKEAVENGKAKTPSDSSVSKDTDAKVAATKSVEVALSQTKEAVENGNAKKTSDSSVAKDTYAKVAASNSSEVASSHTKEAVENGNAKKTSDSSVSKDTYANVVATNSSEVASSHTKEAVGNGNAEKTCDSSVSKDTDAKVAATNSSEVTASCENAFLVLSPVSDVKKEASPKITYASVVAKASPPTSPRITSVHSNFDKKAVVPPTSKASTSLVNGASNVSNPSSTESKPSAPSNATEPKMQPANRIYIGGLPYDITKQRVMEVLKQFGPVRRNSDSIQIRRHEDGFCCGFVEFESVDSARRAIEVHHVKFGKMESYMAYRRSSSDRGNNEKGKGSSPSRNNGLNAKRRIMAEMATARTRNSTRPEDGIHEPIVGRVRRGRLVEIAGIDLH